MPPKAKPKEDGAKKDGAKRPDSAKAGKGAKESARGAKEAAAAGGVSAEDLAQKLAAMQKQLDAEKEQRNFVQLERDRILSFWDVTKGHLEDAMGEGRQKDRDGDHLVEVHQVELKAFKQKIKHLLYEHGLHIEALKADREAALKSATDEFHTREGQLSADKRVLQSQLREQETFFENAAQQARIEAAKRESKLQAQLAAEAKGLADKHEAQLAAMREAAEVQRKQEQHSIEERKNAHIQVLMAQHEKAFADMKTYFNGVVRDNLDAIMALKGELAEHKRKEASTQSLLQEVVAENKRLSEPLDKAQREMEELRRGADAHARDRASLTLARTRLAQATTDLDRMRFENEVWQQRLECEETERKALQQRFDTTVTNLQQSAAATTLLLQKHAESLSMPRLQMEGSGTASDAENQPSLNNSELPRTASPSKRTVSQVMRRTSQGLKALNEPERSPSSDKIAAHRSSRILAQRSSGDAQSSFDDLCIEGVMPPVAGVIHA